MQNVKPVHRIQISESIEGILGEFSSILIPLPTATLEGSLNKEQIEDIARIFSHTRVLLYNQILNLKPETVAFNEAGSPPKLIDHKGLISEMYWDKYEDIASTIITLLCHNAGLTQLLDEKYNIIEEEPDLLTVYHLYTGDLEEAEYFREAVSHEVTEDEAKLLAKTINEEISYGAIDNDDDVIEWGHLVRRALHEIADDLSNEEKWFIFKNEWEAYDFIMPILFPEEYKREKNPENLQTMEFE